jgi:hypothetical protein
MIGNAGDGFVRISPVSVAATVDFTISYSTTGDTTGVVIVTVEAQANGTFSFVTSGWTETSAGIREKTYTENLTGEIVAFTPDGDNNTQYGTVAIDRILPTATISYSTENTTTGTVIATLVPNQSGLTITNNSGNLAYEFLHNGQFIFEFADAFGHTGTTKATVNRITTLYAGCDTLDIQIGHHTIAACNVGSSAA